MRRRDFIGTLLASPLAAWLGIKAKAEPDQQTHQSEWVTMRQFKRVLVHGLDENGKHCSEWHEIPNSKRFVGVALDDSRKGEITRIRFM